MLSKKLLLVLVVGLVLRLISLNQSLWLDEATSIKAATEFSFSEIISEFSPGDFHPPFYYLMLKAWIGFFGSSEVAARSLSVLFGIATLPFVFLIGRRLFNTGVGVIASLLLATSGLHIYYSQEARMYVPATFLATLTVWFFLRVLSEKKTEPINWMGLIVSSVLLVYTDYLPIFLLVALGLYLLFLERKHFLSNLKIWSFVGVAIPLLFIPWLPVLAQQLNLGIGVKSSVPGWWQVLGGTNIKQILLVPVKFMIGRISFYDKNLYALALVLPVVLFGVGVYKAIREVRAVRSVRFVLAWLIMPILFVAILGLRLNVFTYFRLLFVLPAFYLLVSFGIFSIRRESLKVVFIVLVAFTNILATSIYLFNPKFHREDWKSAVGYVEQQGSSSISLFVAESVRDPYRYYQKTVLPDGPFGPKFFDQDHPILDKPINKIWFFRYAQPIFDPGDNLRERIEESGLTKIDEKDFNGVVVWEYSE